MRKSAVNSTKRLFSIVTVISLLLTLSLSASAIEKKTKIISSEKFISDCVEDETGWFESVKNTGEGLESFYNLTGVQPWVMFMLYDADVSSDKERQAYLEDYYLDNFLADDREDVYLFAYFDNDDGGMGSLYSFAGDEAYTVMDEEADELLSDYITELWTSELSTDELVIQSFAAVAESVMSGKKLDITSNGANAPPADNNLIDEAGSYNTKEEVALYIHVYGKLPSNYISKKEAEALGWPGGSLEPYAPGKSIGGSKFGNYEGKLPSKKGRSYTECDIDTAGKKSRGAKRIVFSNDGLIYYTEDHYETFELLYGEE